MAAQVFVEDPEHPELDDDDRHHLVRVLRLGVGECVVAADGRGRSVICRFTGTGSLLEPDGPATRTERPTPLLTVAFAPVKGDRPDWVVQKLTELGVDRIVPLVTERAVVRWSGGRADKAVERLRKVAREAAAQSRRAWLPQVAEPVALGALRDGLLRAGVGLALAERGGKAPSLDWPAIAVGPEGGWGDTERGLGLPPVGLGDTVLRAETAAVAAAALLAGLRARVVGPAP
ncbi:MAG: RsmE family RNA methyltransferase [Acidimicrobiales bacterium]